MQTYQKLSLALQQRFRRQILTRKREMDLVMLDREQVDQYNKSGEDGGLAVLYEFIINTILKYSPVAGTALDICCGPSQLMLRTAQAMPQMHFTGLDLSPRMLQFGMENKKKLALPNAEFKLGSMYALETLFEKKFDLITWCDAMHHCDHEENVIKVLNQINRILKPDGCLLIFDFIRPKTGRLALELSDLYARPFGDWLFQDNLDSYKAAFTFDETEEILQESELKNWRHVQPVIGNMFQLIVVSSATRRDPQKICQLKHGWQKIDYNFLKLIFAGRI
jgi:ubiquinone/menaquinone biosynthesis C-methylase UbiE